MKRALLLLLFLSAITILSTQAQNDTLPKDTIWRTGGLTSLSFNQVSLSNWSAGGDNSIGGNALVSLFAYKKKGKWAWDSNLDLAFGAAKVGDDDWRKSDDKIDLKTKIGRDLGKNFYATYLFGFKTQFTEGFEYPDDEEKFRISNFMTPGYFINSLGIDWKPSDFLSIYISPLTMKTTVVTDETLIRQYEADGISFYGVDPGEKVRNETGAYFMLKYKTEIMENMLFDTKLELFSNYSNEPQNVDVNWEVILAMKVNKYINVLLQTQLIYDNDVFIPKGVDNEGGPGTQFKETFGLGFAYKFEGYGVR